MEMLYPKSKMWVESCNPTLSKNQEDKDEDEDKVKTLNDFEVTATGANGTWGKHHSAWEERRTFLSTEEEMQQNRKDQWNLKLFFFKD